MTRKDRDLLAGRIEKVLWQRWHDSTGDSFDLQMKSGSVVTITVVYRGPYRNRSGWHSGRTHYVVSSTAMEEKKYFRLLSGIARSMAYGYIR